MLLGHVTMYAKKALYPQTATTAPSCDYVNCQDTITCNPARAGTQSEGNGR
ncbi:hypothetical protein HCTV-8_gp41 [Haloarcula virus HCTV-8]|uniref:Uncharacterized protein n=4 Tax=Haloferacalesvirus hv5 TaxID=1273753 RepID=A0AAE8XUP2_9CAUD|nr:hypothetical protein HCTV-7_gp43 [Haloarcula phage HCTV-7]UBF20484.1 hypothetical protein HCTV-9_gp43 [Haloarcula phage HCTV-9]UBF20600.1 hypothetical protein HCTV-11_gp43 [Haloarcula phage HCTV-11]UBF20827.1 hypothetical protein HRTV-16_gp41 [Halorubrum virus HRTV-16]UBF20940.1 hypothetical protein HCTV-8_gp41 [Haloarcula virus HCTV-8]UBF21052.1 hypothetical protein HCTV-10_gp41 [Haloarcula virus HCTV-10]UBF21287.1 hypothetical protein HRTV-13_gp41 [Halorubrum phage HRTV-13]UBF21407.1 hy